MDITINKDNISFIDSEDYIYNTSDFITGDNEFDASLSGQINENKFLLRTGGQMTGSLSCPNVNVIQTTYNDGSIQETAYSATDRANIDEATRKLAGIDRLTDISNIEYTDIFRLHSGYFSCDNINVGALRDLSDNVQELLTSLKTKTTGINYNGVRSDISNAYIATLTAGNINVNHLNGTMSNLQTQINDVSASILSLPTNASLNQKTTGIFYDASENLTTVDNNMTVSIGKKLYVNGQDVHGRFNNIEAKTSKMVYDSSYNALNVDISYFTVFGTSYAQTARFDNFDNALLNGLTSNVQSQLTAQSSLVSTHSSQIASITNVNNSQGNNISNLLQKTSAISFNNVDSNLQINNASLTVSGNAYGVTPALNDSSAKFATTEYVINNINGFYEYRTAGTYLLDVPSWVRSYEITCIGAGASGGTAWCGNIGNGESHEGGAGGSNGGCSRIKIGKMWWNIQITVGAGGASVTTYGTPGNAGGSSYVTINGNNMCLATGGGAGSQGGEASSSDGTQPQPGEGGTGNLWNGMKGGIGGKNGSLNGGNGQTSTGLASGGSGGGGACGRFNSTFYFGLGGKGGGYGDDALGISGSTWSQLETGNGAFIYGLGANGTPAKPAGSNYFASVPVPPNGVGSPGMSASNEIYPAFSQKGGDGYVSIQFFR